MFFFTSLYNLLFNSTSAIVKKAEDSLQKMDTLIGTAREQALQVAVSHLLSVKDSNELLKEVHKESPIATYLPQLIVKTMEQDKSGNDEAFTNLMMLSRLVAPLTKEFVTEISIKVLNNEKFYHYVPAALHLAGQDKIEIPLDVLNKYVYDQSDNNAVNHALASYLQSVKEVSKYDLIADTINTLSMPNSVHNVEKMALQFAEHVNKASIPSDCSVHKAIQYMSLARPEVIKDNKLIGATTAKLLKFMSAKTAVDYPNGVKNLIAAGRAANSLKVHDADTLVDKVLSYSAMCAIDLLTKNALVISDHLLNAIYAKTNGNLSSLQKFKEFIEIYPKLIADDNLLDYKFMNHLNALAISAHKLVLEQKESLLEAERIERAERESNERIEKIKQNAEERVKKLMEENHKYKIKYLKDSHLIEKALLESKLTHLEKLNVDMEKRETEMKLQMKELADKIAIYEPAPATEPLNEFKIAPEYAPSAPPLPCDPTDHSGSVDGYSTLYPQLYPFNPDSYLGDHHFNN